MKRLFFMLCLCSCMPALAQTLPENVFFRAMQDEMQRTRAHLRVKGSAKPFYIAYSVMVPEGQTFGAELGAPFHTAAEPVHSGANVTVYMYAGNRRQNSSGFADRNGFPTVSNGHSGLSYEALRHTLWRLSDVEYVRVSNLAAKKEAYKRQKNLQNQPDDFSAAPQAGYAEAVPPFIPRDGAVYTQLAQELSAAGQGVAGLEHYRVSLTFGQYTVYFLDSEGNFSQVSYPNNFLMLSAQWRHADGYVENRRESFLLPLDRAQETAFIQAQADAFLESVRLSIRAQRADPYLGPVLLTPRAAGEMFTGFVRALQNTKPFLVEGQETDVTVGSFKNKVNMRVLSPLWQVFDRPQERAYKGIPLAGFTPVDEEGVRAETLHVVEKGKLKTLPTVRSLLKGQTQSNGHAHFGAGYPRALLSNVFFEPAQALSAAQLEEELLKRCQAQELEYCYIVHEPDRLAERIYTADGRKEPVYGFTVDLPARSWRDIWAAGDDAQVYNTTVDYMAVSLVVPSVLIDEVEIMPREIQPDQAPFVPMP